MDTLYLAILDFFNSFLPNDVQIQYATFNQALAYFLTILILWAVIFRPLLKLFKVIR
jgi:hypothetical protein